MQTIPFLTNFKIKRNSDPITESIVLKYDEILNHNLIINEKSESLLAMTKTDVKAEQPDVDEDFENIVKMNNYFGTKSITAVQAEKPDEIDDQFLLALAGTETFTRTISEAPDQDYNN